MQRRQGLWRGRFDAGFTLVEVLIVAAIVALLIAVLIPSLARVREQARSSQCQGFLDQQGVAAFMFAHERRGFLPSANSNSLEALPRETAVVLDQMVSRAYEVFYCPANNLSPQTPENFKISIKSPESNPQAARILYWWVANPAKENNARFLDTDNDGSVSDEYLRKIDAKRICDIAISTDQSRQERPAVNDGLGWYFVHGRQALRRGMVDTRGLTAWKNNLYGDGHVSMKPASAVIPRWGPDNRAGW